VQVELEWRSAPRQYHATSGRRLPRIAQLANMLTDLLGGFLLAYAALALGFGATAGPYIGIWFGILSLTGVVAAVGVFLRKPWGLIAAAMLGTAVALTASLAGLSLSAFLLNAAFGLGLMFYLANAKFSEAPKYPSYIRSAVTDTTKTEEGRVDMPESPDIERLKYELEREKFLWQKANGAYESRILNRNFGVIITAIVSLAAVIVSYLQLSISSNNTKVQIENEKAQVENEQLKNDRLFYFEVAKFLLDHQAEMTTRQNDQVLYLRNVVISSFPRNVAIQIASSMRDTAAVDSVRKIWQDGLIYLQNKR